MICWYWMYPCRTAPGFEFCKRVRQVSKVPIIFLTASDEETSIFMGLDMGGDRLYHQALQAWSPGFTGQCPASPCKGFQRNGHRTAIERNQGSFAQGQAFKNGELLDLTAAEYKLLCLFMRNPNTVLTKEQILDKLWDCDGNYIDSSTLTVYMRRLRMKIEDNPSDPQMLLTVRRMGYKWNVVG